MPFHASLAHIEESIHHVINHECINADHFQFIEMLLSAVTDGGGIITVLPDVMWQDETFMVRMDYLSSHGSSLNELQ